MNASKKVEFIPIQESPVFSPRRSTIAEIEETNRVPNDSKKSGFFASSATQVSLYDEASQITSASLVTTPKKSKRDIDE